MHIFPSLEDNTYPIIMIKRRRTSNPRADVRVSNIAQGLPILDEAKLAMRAQYEQGAAICAMLALNELEQNCIAALFDPHCLGEVETLVAATSGGRPIPPHPPTPPRIPDYIAYPKPFVCATFVPRMREMLESLAINCEPPPKWNGVVRTRHVFTHALSKHWKIPQTKLRIAIRSLEQAGLVSENRLDDSVCLNAYNALMCQTMLEQAVA